MTIETKMGAGASAAVGDGVRAVADGNDGRIRGAQSGQ